MYIMDFDISFIYNYIYIYCRIMIIPQRNHMEIMVPIVLNTAHFCF